MDSSLPGGHRGPCSVRRGPGRRERRARGVSQYVILGSGLDPPAQRRPEIASHMHVFEVDRPGPQGWKRQRLIDLGFGVPEWLRLVPVYFEAGAPWLQSAFGSRIRSGPAGGRGVDRCFRMYLTHEAIPGDAPPGRHARARQHVRDDVHAADRSPRTRGSPLVRVGARGRPGIPDAIRRPVFAPGQVLALARQAGFKNAEHVSLATLAQRYFAGRTDGLRPSSGEDFLVATT